MNHKLFGCSVYFWLVCLTLLLGVSLRWYKIDNPVADWHSFRQADTAAVTRYYVQHGLDLLHPRYHDLSSLQSGQANPEGYRMVEFPVFNLLHWLMYQLFGGQVSLEMAGRMTGILAYLLAGWGLAVLLGRQKSKRLGWWAVWWWTALPFSIYYSRVILPDMLAVAWAVWSLVWLNLALKQGKWWQLLAVWLFASLALLTKPTSGFLLLAGLTMFSPNLWQQPRVWWAAVSLLLSLLPLAWWRQWISQFPAGIPAYDWLFNQDHIRLKPAWWRWLWFERIGKLILGVWAAGIVSFGLVHFRARQAFRLALGLTLAAVLYLIVIAAGNVRHDYYQIMILPAVVAWLALGSDYLWQEIKPAWWGRLVWLMLVALALAFSWYQIKDYYQINRPAIVTAGKAVDRLTPPDALVIAPYFGDTAFLYQTNRRGWPFVVSPDQISELINQGARYYVSVNYDDLTKQLMQQYPVLEQTDDYVIIELSPD